MSVDDDAINQMVAETVLKSHKWGVVKCMDGLKASTGRWGWGAEEKREGGGRRPTPTRAHMRARKRARRTAPARGP